MNRKINEVWTCEADPSMYKKDLSPTPSSKHILLRGVDLGTGKVFINIFPSNYSHKQEEFHIINFHDDVTTTTTEKLVEDINGNWTPHKKNPFLNLEPVK